MLGWNLIGILGKQLLSELELNVNFGLASKLLSTINMDRFYQFFCSVGACCAAVYNSELD